jgi:hypothetical protein
MKICKSLFERVVTYGSDKSDNGGKLISILSSRSSEETLQSIEKQRCTSCKRGTSCVYEGDDYCRVYVSGKWYCGACMQIPCDACKRPVEIGKDTVISSEYRPLHRGCSYQCNQCHRVLISEPNESHHDPTMNCGENVCVVQEKCEKCGGEIRNGFFAGQIFCQKGMCTKDMWQVLATAAKEKNTK